MANPLMSESIFSKIEVSENTDKMTLHWTINKSLFLVSITILTTIWVWNYAELFLTFVMPIALVAFVIWLIIIFVKNTSPFLSPIYAILEWLAIWTISALFEKDFPWIVIQAVSLTFWVFVIMLLAYKSKIIKATENFKTWVIACTWAIASIYLISLIWYLTWTYTVPYIHESWIIWICFSIFAVVIASLNLILDFDNVEIWVSKNLPKYMEWYASFWLLITLIWLYLEILRLLAKSRSK